MKYEVRTGASYQMFSFLGFRLREKSDETLKNTLTICVGNIRKKLKGSPCPRLLRTT